MNRRSLQHASFFLLVALVTLAFYEVIAQFFQPLFWAAVFATLFYRPFRALRAKLGNPSLAAVLSVVLILLIVLLPLAAIGAAVINESINVYDRIASGEIDPRAPVVWAEQYLPRAQALAERFNVDLEGLQTQLETAAVAISQGAATVALNVAQNAARITALTFLMLYVLFFFLRDGEDIVEALIRALPFGDERERQLLGRFSEVSRATIKGTLVVGGVQGFLGGIAFALLGLPAAVFWGVVMTVFSLLPAVGAAIVWGPAAIYLLATGSILKGILLIVFGALVVGLVDNVLRPILVGRDTKMPDFLILLSTLGGLGLFGLSGFVIGPLVAALFLTVWEQFAVSYASEESEETVERIEETATEEGGPEVTETEPMPEEAADEAPRQTPP